MLPPATPYTASQLRGIRYECLLVTNKHITKFGLRYKETSFILRTYYILDPRLKIKGTKMCVWVTRWECLSPIYLDKCTPSVPCLYCVLAAGCRYCFTLFPFIISPICFSSASHANMDQYSLYALICILYKWKRRKIVESKSTGWR